MVKRTVRVVKKIVKKKVTKKGQTGPSVDSIENPKPDDTVCMEIEHSEPIVTVFMDPEHTSPNPSAIVSTAAVKPSGAVENTKGLEVGEGGKDGCLIEQVSEVQLDGVAANTGGDQVDGGVGATIALLEDQDMVLTDYQKDKGNDENANYDSFEGKEGVMEQSLKESECSEFRTDDGGLETENVVGGSHEAEERGKEQAYDGEIGGMKVEVRLRDGVLLSGEMEALERQRRRKTEIFIGGLDKETKEEDMRKVFEVVGEIIEVRVVKDGKTGKSKGFAFVRYASADDAKTALVKYHKVEICGRQCSTAPVEGNDTIFLGNIDKKWKSEDVLKRLQEIGIEEIDNVTVVADPNNLALNRGFAFLELKTKKDAQTAFHKLQKKDVFGKHLKIKIAWAEPLIEPDEEEMLKVKSVYAEYIPSSWDEEKVKDYFKRFGDIENVALARNLRSPKRKDFAFVNYKTREAALACIEAFNHEQLYDEGSKVNVKVSLAKPIPKGKQIKHVSKPPSMKIPKKKRDAALAVLPPHELRNMAKSAGNRYEDTRADGKSSTTVELVQLLREQASWGPAGASSSIAPLDRDNLQPSPGWKRSSAVLSDEFYSDPRGYPRMRLESSYPIANPSSTPLYRGAGVISLPGYNRHGANFPTDSFYTVEEHPTYSRTRDRAPYHGSSGLYRRY